MVKLVDTYDLGSYARACRFESCYPHQPSFRERPKKGVFLCNNLIRSSFYSLSFFPSGHLTSKYTYFKGFSVISIICEHSFIIMDGSILRAPVFPFASGNPALPPLLSLLQTGSRPHRPSSVRAPVLGIQKEKRHRQAIPFLSDYQECPPPPPEPPPEKPPPEEPEDVQLLPPEEPDEE